MSDVDKALRLAESRDYTMVRYHPTDPFQILAAEVRRLRAAVEAVRALPEYYFSDIYPLVYRDDVLRILEGE